MSGWIQCPHCGLKHTGRENGLCPRCQQNVGAPGFPGLPQGDQMYQGDQVYQPPAVPAAAGASRDDSGIGWGVRIGGGVLVLNAIVLALSAFGPGSGDVVSRFGGRSFFIDAILGLFLLAGSKKALLWTKVRVVLGALVFTILFAARGDLASAVVQLALSGSLIGLLFGRASALRIALCAATAGIYFLVSGAGFLFLNGGNPIAAKLMELSGEIEAVDGSEVEGRAFSYRVQIPNDTWFLRKTEAAQKDNPLADRWLVSPGNDAHVLIIGERVAAGATVDLEAYQAAILENTEKAASEFEFVDSTPVRFRSGFGRLVHTRGTINGIGIEYYHGLLTRQNLAFQIVGFTSQQKFSDMEGELKEIITSFKLTER